MIKDDVSATLDQSVPVITLVEEEVLELLVVVEGALQLLHLLREVARVLVILLLLVHHYFSLLG